MCADLKSGQLPAFVFMGSFGVESIRKSELEERLIQLCDRTLEPEGFRTVDVDCVVGGRSTFRVFVEPKVQERETTLDDCRRVSLLLGPVMEVEPLVSGPYDLEVSSPGLDRRLRTVSDFEKQLGKEVQLRFIEKVEGLGGKNRVWLSGVEGAKVVLSYQGQEYKVLLSNIRRANVVWAFEDSRGNGNAPKKQKKGKH